MVSSNTAGIQLLRHVLFETDLKVLFVTGAGISVKSGVPLYRSGEEEEEDEESSSDTGVESEDSIDTGESSDDNENDAQKSVNSDNSDNSDNSSSSSDQEEELEAYVAISGDEKDSPVLAPAVPPLDVIEPALPPEEAKAKEARRRRHRQRSSAIWSKKLTTMGQRLAFLANPRAWYRYFWFDTHHVEAFLQAAPNASHVTMGFLCERWPERFKVITQNVDRLHQRAGCPLPNLIEVHGRIGVYRCTDLVRCEYGSDRTLYPEDLLFMSPEEEAAMPKLGRAAGSDIEEAFVTEARREPLDLAIPPDFPLPCCPKCRNVVMPMTLLFDEAYGTHQFFQIYQAQDWILDADVFVFAGTSFSVHFTEMVLSRVRQNSSLAFHLNVAPNSTGVFSGFEDALKPRERHGARSTVSPATIESNEPVQLNWDSGSEPEMDNSSFLLDRPSRPTICEIIMPAEETFIQVLPSEYKMEVEKRVKDAELRKIRRHWEAKD